MSQENKFYAHHERLSYYFIENKVILLKREIMNIYFELYTVIDRS